MIKYDLDKMIQIKYDLLIIWIFEDRECLVSS